MKILFIVTRSDTIGGSHIHVRDLAQTLMVDGHTVNVCIGGSGPIINYYREFGLNVINILRLKRNISPIDDLLAYKQIKEEIQQFKPDLVSTHSSKAGFLGRIAASNLNVPVLFTAHGWSFTTGKSSMRQYLFRSLEKIVARKTDRMITVSNYDKKLAMNHLPVSPEKITTIHNGMKDVDPSLLANPGYSGTVNIVKIARFDQQKDHLELLEAVHPIEGIHLHFIGDGPLMEPVKKKAREYGIIDDITFWGRLDSVDEVLSKGQIFVLISNWEGFPRSTLEAMRVGLPTIVSDVGGSGEAVVEGVTGYAIKKGDIDSLQKIIEGLVRDPARREKMGAAARHRYEELFTFKHMYDKTLAVYQDMLNSNHNVHERK